MAGWTALGLRTNVIADGHTEDITTLMSLALASSTIERKLSSIISKVDGAGVAGDVVGAGQDHDDLRLEGDYVGAETDHICGVVWPLMPRSMWGLPSKNAGERLIQASVMESPMKTTRFSPAAGGASFALSSA